MDAPFRLLTPEILALIFLYIDDEKSLILSLLCMYTLGWTKLDAFRQVLDCVPLEAHVDPKGCVYFNRNNLMVFHNNYGGISVRNNLFCINVHEPGYIAQFHSFTGVLTYADDEILEYSSHDFRSRVTARERRPWHNIGTNGVVLFTPRKNIVWKSVSGPWYCFGTWLKDRKPDIKREKTRILSTAAFYPKEDFRTAHPIFLEFYDRFRQIAVLAEDFAQQDLKTPVFLTAHPVYTAVSDLFKTFYHAIEEKCV